MKKSIIVFVILSLLVGSFFTSCSDAFWEEMLEPENPETTPTNYSKDVSIFDIDSNGVLSLKSGAEVPADVIIPKVVDETTVTSLNDAIFESCSTLETVLINGQISAISDAAFISCPALTAVILEDGVSTIGSAAFADCGSLVSVSSLGTTTVNYASDAFDDISLITFTPSELFVVLN